MAKTKAGDLDLASDKLTAAKKALGAIVFGQDSVIEEALIAILAGGHGLIVGAPGLAKTKLAAALGTVLGLSEKRIQFTPDLMPADIIGSEILDQDDKGKRAFRFVPGPVFSQLVMADEINRASPRTQSALLQAMQEHAVTVAGVRHVLPEPFHVLATQNPIEQEGTYPLPEAQLDRFLLQIDISYPLLEAERQMLFATTGNAENVAQQVMTSDELAAIQRLVRDVPVGEQVTAAILNVVRAARPGVGSAAFINEAVAWGPSPRAAQSLMLCAKARALLQGRLSPSVEDVLALAQPVLKHRMALNFAARADGVTLPSVISKLAQSLT
ncbi:AAA family ATPase [Aestuariivirga litoralis]|uniref:AAA family ATPase n=1 Tax=Aestuariivirga litoralis TaxID=2650924 RepID=UPI0018C4D18D|nr:MoxR family ATPase [Aestuariivirga litoralis]MBG1230951.1 MoxR family ATPase [Aestuariivirga litoralis]